MSDKRKKKSLVGWIKDYDKLDIRSQFVNIDIVRGDKLAYPISDDMVRVRITIEEIE